MNKRSFAIMLGLWFLLVFLVLGGSFLMETVQQSNLVRRYLYSVRSFWTAEAGIAQGIQGLPDCITNNNCQVTGTITYSPDNYQYTATIQDLNNSYYQIDSVATGMSVTRSVSTVVKRNTLNAGDFKYALESHGDFDIGGSAAVNPADSVHEQSDFEFEKLFGATKDQVKAAATNFYIDPENNAMPCTGLTWVDVSPGEEFKITSNGWSGEGVMVVSGDVKITGGSFRGILYVMDGQLEVDLSIAGNPVIDGTVLVECDSSNTVKIRGNPEFNYDPDAIVDALNNLAATTTVVAWWEPT